MSEHTPGPWGIDRSIGVWIMAGSLHVATIPRAADGDWSPANARLIAAAPDMLEALKMARKWMSWWSDVHPDDKVVIAINDAIAKAEGAPAA